jgi:hypothetical protein
VRTFLRILISFSSPLSLLPSSSYFLSLSPIFQKHLFNTSCKTIRSLHQFILHNYYSMRLQSFSFITDILSSSCIFQWGNSDFWLFHLG